MNSMLEYLGYHAKIEFDADDKLFIGEVFGISDSLNFHGSSVSEIEEMFHQSIDNYINMCKEMGKEPDKEYKGSFNVRVTPELHQKAALEAYKQDIPLNQFVSLAIEKSLRPSKESIVYLMPQITKTTTWDLGEQLRKEMARYNKQSEIREVHLVG